MSDSPIGFLTFHAIVEVCHCQLVVSARIVFLPSDYYRLACHQIITAWLEVRRMLREPLVQYIYIYCTVAVQGLVTLVPWLGGPM